MHEGLMNREFITTTHVLLHNRLSELCQILPFKHNGNIDNVDNLYNTRNVG